MTADEFRQLALSLPEVVEGAQMGHADFRIGSKIFATLGYPDADHSMIILPPDEQKEYVTSHRTAFAAATGAWSDHGATNTLLGSVDVETASDALASAWR